jgi:hypothetical protein
MSRRAAAAPERPGMPGGGVDARAVDIEAVIVLGRVCKPDVRVASPTKRITATLFPTGA